MPLIVVQYKAGDQGLKRIAQKLANKLPGIAAAALTVGNEKSNGLVTPDDIEVWCNEGSPADVNTKDLEIVIWAHQFEERMANLEERKDTILNYVRTFLTTFHGHRKLTGWVWILLQPTAFGQI